jgi:hypothetical protein
MVRPDRIAEIDDKGTSLWLVVKWGEQTLAFEFESDSARIITVGSAEHSDVRLDDVEAAPLVCYFERDRDKLWLVPGYRCKHLRADTTIVERPRKLRWRSIIEYPGMTLEVRVREEPPTSPDNEKPLPVSFFSDKTSSSDEPTVTLGRVVVLDEQWNEIEEEIPTLVSVPTSRRSAPYVLNEPSASERELGQDELRIVGRPIVSIGEESTEQKLRTNEFGAFHDVLNQPRLKETRYEAQSEPLSMSPSVISLRVEGTRNRHLLAALGETTRRRPGLVALGASVGAGVLVMLMLFVSRIISSNSFDGRDGHSNASRAAASVVPNANFGQIQSPGAAGCASQHENRCAPSFGKMDGF